MEVEAIETREGSAMVSPGTERAVRQPPAWVTRAKLADHWRYAVATAEKMDRDVLVTTFANCYVRWCDENFRGDPRHGENGTRGAADAGDGTRAGDGRRMPTWVRRAKLVVYWRYATQVAGTMTRADLESAFACEYTSRWKTELECERLRVKGGV